MQRVETRGNDVVLAPKSKRKESNICYQFNKSDTCTFGEKRNFFHIPAAAEASAPAGGGAWGQGADDNAGARARARTWGGASSAFVVRAAGGGWSASSGRIAGNARR